MREYINLQTILRSEGISTEIYPGEGKLKKHVIIDGKYLNSYLYAKFK